MKLTIKIISWENTVKGNVCIYLIVSMKCEKIHYHKTMEDLLRNNFLKVMISHVWYDYFCRYKTGRKGKHSYTMKFSLNMKRNYILISMLSIGICGLVIASTVVLSLIPLYTPASDETVSTKDKLCLIVSLWLFDKFWTVYAGHGRFNIYLPIVK